MHQKSKRNRPAFITVNCTLESAHIAAQSAASQMRIETLAVYPLAECGFQVNLKGNFDWHENVCSNTAVKSGRKKEGIAAEFFRL
jgi:hypothetical protein